MTCTVEKRTRIRETADAIRAHPKCAGVTVLAPETGPHAGWALECTLTTTACPPGVLRALASRRLRVREARPRGRGFHVVATV